MRGVGSSPPYGLPERIVKTLAGAARLRCEGLPGEAGSVC